MRTVTRFSAMAWRRIFLGPRPRENLKEENGRPEGKGGLQAQNLQLGTLHPLSPIPHKPACQGNHKKC